MPNYRIFNSQFFLVLISAILLSACSRYGSNAELQSALFKSRTSDALAKTESCRSWVKNLDSSKYVFEKILLTSLSARDKSSILESRDRVSDVNIKALREFLEWDRVCNEHAIEAFQAAHAPYGRIESRYVTGREIAFSNFLTGKTTVSELNSEILTLNAIAQREWEEESRRVDSDFSIQHQAEVSRRQSQSAAFAAAFPRPTTTNCFAYGGIIQCTTY